MGTNKVPVKGKRSFYSHAYLRGMAWNAYEAAELKQPGCNLHGMSVVVFCAFTLEAYLNRIGMLRLRHWPLFERRLSWREKLELIGSELGTSFDRGKRPFQTMAEAFAFRDRLAHGKSVVDEEFSGQYTLGEHADDSYLDPRWLEKYQSLEKIKAVLDDLEAALRQLQSAAGLNSEPLGLIAEGESEGPSAS